MLLALSPNVLRRVFSIVVFVAFVVGCGGPSVVSVLPARPSAEEDRASPLRVVIDATTTHLPLAVAGANVAYGDVDRALARAVEHALETTSQDLARRNARQLGLAVDLVEAHAEYSHDRLVVRMTVRATLRETLGNVYLAQTHAHSSASAVVAAESGARVVLDCTDSIGHQLSGWLSGMELR
jgi:hypothetical protein